MLFLEYPKKGSILSNMSKGAKARLTKLTSKEIKASKAIGKLLVKITYTLQGQILYRRN